MSPNALMTVTAILCVAARGPLNAATFESKNETVERVVAREVRRVSSRFEIPGMAVGIVTNGRKYLYHFGIASRATKKPVASDTLFEIGSISKTFTATLASYAQLSGKLSLDDEASAYMPGLRGSSFDKVSLRNLGTHTSGGLPLQVPNSIANDAQLMAYFRKWKPAFAPGTVRTYSNPSIGLLGMIAAKSMGQSFDSLVEGRLLPKLGMHHTYLDVPRAQMHNYAQGYTTKDRPVRMMPGVLASEAYGLKTTAGDLLHFVEANMRLADLDKKWQRAISLTHTGYYGIGAMTQDLVWEQYPDTVPLADLLAGNSSKVSFEPNPVVEIRPPRPPQDNVLINKTGSTNGFAAYVMFCPGKKTGIVLLANKSYPIDARVTAAYEILKVLTGEP